MNFFISDLRHIYLLKSTFNLIYSSICAILISFSDSLCTNGGVGGGGGGRLYDLCFKRPMFIIFRYTRRALVLVGGHFLAVGQSGVVTSTMAV